jgi:DNA-binding beta-propeller fold protein YncE
VATANRTALESFVMKQLSSLAHNARRRAAQLLPAAALTLLLGSPVSAQPLAQAGGLEPSAPENLRCPGQPGPRDGYHFEAQWQNVATYSGPVVQIALDHSCNLFVLDTAGNQVVKYNTDGQQVAAFKLGAREPGTDPPAGVATAPDGTLYVADPGLHSVHKLSPSGQELGTWKSCDCVDQPGWMVAPVSVAVDGTGNNVYVLDQSADTISRYSPDGKVQKVFGSQGTRPGQFDVPKAITLDRQGNIYVADWGNHRIQKFSPEGAPLGQFGVDGNGAGQIHLPSGIAVDRDGNMYVSDSDNWRMIKFAADGTPVDQFPPCASSGECGVLDGSDPGQFFDHNGVVVDGQGNLYVADSGNDRVERRVVIEVENPPAASIDAIGA